MYGNFEVHSSFLIRRRIDHLNAHEPAHPLAADMDIVGSFHVVKSLVLRKLGADTVSRHGLLCVIVAPTGIGFIDCLGAGFAVGFESDIALGLQKLDHIVAAALDRLHILSGLARNAELIVVPDQPVQPLQTPEKDALLFPQQLVHQKRIVRSACGPVFGGQHDLAAKEAVGLGVQGGERTVSEAEKTHIELALIALNALALHIHLALGGHDVLDIVGLGGATLFLISRIVTNLPALRSLPLDLTVILQPA